VVGGRNAEANPQEIKYCRQLMRIALICVGRAKASAEQEICDGFLKRIRGAGKNLGFTQIDLEIVETSRASSAQARKAQEAERLGRCIASGAHRIAMDERANALASEDFARHLEKLRDSGARDLAFVIGGPDGLASDIREAAEEKMSLGPQTWPHLLVRAMLAEQIFRACTILAGHPYHRGG
jgi:23S rRNA (pseudouridine1915-N3)-methyltransferase